MRRRAGAMRPFRTMGISSRAQAAWRAFPAMLVVALLLPDAATGAPDLPPLINSRPGDVRTLLLTDCAKYQDWQKIAAAFVWLCLSTEEGSLSRS